MNRRRRVSCRILEMRDHHFIAILALLVVPLACAPAPQAVEPAAPAELKAGRTHRLARLLGRS